MRGFGGLVLLVLLLGTLIRYWWVFAAAAATVLLGVALWRLIGRLDRWLDARERRRGAERYARAQIAARADEQNRLYLAGDPRGVYGDFLPSQLGTS